MVVCSLNNKSTPFKPHVYGLNRFSRETCDHDGFAEDSKPAQPFPAKPVELAQLFEQLPWGLFEQNR
jgi:hypothetical protein